MPAVATKATISYILREHIDDGTAWTDYVAEDDRFIAWLDHTENGGGLYNRMAFTDKPAGGVGWSFGAAQAGKQSATGDDWQVDWYELDALFSISHKTWRYNRHSVDRLEEMVKIELDSVAKKYRMLLGYALWRSGTGSLDVIASVSSGTSFALTNRHASWVIQPNMELQVATDDGAGAGVVANEIVRVTNVQNQGTARTVFGNFTAPNWAAGRFVYPRDGYNNVVQGVLAWCPLTAPSDTFNGVLRTNNPLRYGTIFDPTGLPVTNLAEYLVWQATIFFEENPDMKAEDVAIWMNPRMQGHLTNVLGVKLRFCSDMISLRGDGNERRGKNGNPITVPQAFLPTEQGEIAIMTHRDITYGHVYMLNRKSMKLSSMGKLFAPFDDFTDGGSEVVHTAENAYEERMGGYPNLHMSAPHHNCVGNASAFVPAIS